MKKHLHLLRLFVLFSAACLSVVTCNSQVDTNQSASLDQTAPIQIGQPIHAVDPKIPKELRKKNVSAVFSATISSSGEFSNLTALNGDPAFTNIALDAVRQWRYSPPMQDGKALDAKVYVLISADHGKVLSSVEPELPVPTQPREPLKELFTSERLFRKKLGLALDRKAIDAVRTWKFEPATRDGEPVPVLINVEVMFRLY